MGTLLTTVANHHFPEGVDTSHFVTTTSGIATMSTSHDSNRDAVVMSIGTTTDSKISFVQNMWNKPPGGAVFGCEFTIAAGDSGKVNLSRRIGMFTNKSGLFFEMRGTDIYCVTRSNATGTPVDTRYIQADWTGDKLDGNGGQDNLTKHTLDQTNINSMFLEWNEMRDIKFGFFIHGARVIVHEVHGEDFALPVITNQSLPLRFEQENLGTTASTSEMYIYDAGVFCGEADYDFAADSELRSFDFSQDGGTVVASGIETFLFAGRAKALLNGEENPTVSLISDTYTYLEGSTPVVFTLYKNPTLTGALWAINPGSDVGIEIDVHATGFSGGERRSTGMLQPGQVNHSDLTDFCAGITR